MWGTELIADVERWVKAGDLDGARQRLADMLHATGVDGFTRAARGGFSNPPDEVRRWLQRCAGLLTEREGEYAALYTEMNGYTINPDHWSAGLEAWSVPIDDFETLDDSGQADFPLHYREDLTLRGWASMQASFERYVGEHAPRSEEVAAARAIADLLVHVAFLRLIRDAWMAGPIVGVSVPLAVTTHDSTLGIVLQPLASRAPDARVLPPAFAELVASGGDGQTTRGAGDGNRTRMTSLEGWGSAIELRPRAPVPGTGPG